MTFDKFMHRNQIIGDQLAKIAQRRRDLGWTGWLQPTDRRFREVLHAQERLLNAVENLLDGASGDVRA
jgi:hypothetical protein